MDGESGRLFQELDELLFADDRVLDGEADYRLDYILEGLLDFHEILLPLADDIDEVLVGVELDNNVPFLDELPVEVDDPIEVVIDLR